jgi:putative endonuclease
VPPKRALLTEQSRKGNGPVVQLVRMPPCHGGGRGFESRPVRIEALTKVEAFFVMGFFVYILQSDIDHSYYKGFSEDPIERILQHNSGLSRYTSGKLPWRLVYIEELATKRDALIRERSIKKYSHGQIAVLIQSPKNIHSNF